MKISTIDKLKCTGCGVCTNACARAAIAMVEDVDGFLYPHIDDEKCVDCGLCARVCPVFADEKRILVSGVRPLAVYAARAKETDLRMKCASGGIFSLLAKKTIVDGGVVFGVVWDEKLKKTRFACAKTCEELVPMRDSKYVQADAGDVYKDVKAWLKDGKRVLFSGTPCQIYALNCFLGCEHENLTTVEVICMGVPSVKLLAKIHPEAFADGSDEVKVVFRDKFKTGWLGSCLVNGPDIRVDSMKHGSKASKEFYRIMADHHCQRESCYGCIARGHHSGADLTIGDFWHVGRFYLEMDDDKGTSLVLVNTPQGRLAWDSLARVVDSCVSDYETALSINRQLVEQLARSPKRRQFTELMRANVPLEKMTSILTPPRPLWRRIASKLKRMVIR